MPAPVGSRRSPGDRARAGGKRRLRRRRQRVRGPRRLHGRSEHRARRGPALRPGDRSRRDGLVLVARARRPQRRPPAGDRRALLLHVRLRREGAPARQGDGDEGPGLRPRGGRRPRRRQAAGDRRRRQRGHGRRVRAPGRAPEARARLARVDVQRRPVPGGARDGRRRSRRRRPHRGRRHDDQHLVDGIAGVRLRREGLRVPAEGRSGDGVAPLQHAVRQGQRRRLQRRRQPRLRRVRGERRHRQPRRRPATRDRRHVRQPPDQRLQPRRDVGARVSVVPEPRQPPQRAPARLGPVHPLAQPGGRGSPLPPARRPLAAPEDGDVAAMDGLAAVDRRPRPRRPERGDRPAERGDERAVRDAGLRVHGARRRAGRRSAVGAEAPRVRDAAAERQARRAAGRRLVPAVGHPRSHDRRHRRRPAAGDRCLGARRLRLRRRPDGEAPLALRLRQGRAEDVRLGGRRRRSQPRRDPRARLRHLRAGAGLRPARRALGRRQAALRHQAAAPGEKRERDRRPRGARRSATSTRTEAWRSC